MIILKAFKLVPLGTYPESLDLNELYAQSKDAIVELCRQYGPELCDQVNGPEFEVHEINVINPRKDQLKPGVWEIIWVDPSANQSNIPGYIGKNGMRGELVLMIQPNDLENWEGWKFLE